MVDANQGWRMAGDRSARWDVATAAQCARALERARTSTGSRSRCATDDVDGYAALRRLHVAADRRRGDGARAAAEARDLLLRGGVDVIQPDVVLAGGLGGCRRIAALADLCGRAFSPAHLVERARPRRQPAPRAAPSPRAPTSRSRSTRRPGRPARRDWLLPAPVEIAAGRDDRPAAPVRASASSPTSRRSSRCGSRDGGPRRRAASSPAGRSRSRGRARSPRAPARCSCGSPRPASATPTCTWPTASSARGAGRSCSATRAPARSRRSGAGVDGLAPGDRVAFCFVPSCGTCRACAAGRFNLCETVLPARVGGHAARRHVAAPARAAARRSSTSTSSPASPSTASSPRAAPSPLPDALPLWQAALVGLRRGHRRRRRAQRRARRGRGHGVRDRLRRRRAADRRAAPRWRARAGSSPSTPTRRSARWRRRAGRPTRWRPATTRSRPCSRSSRAASTTRSRRSGTRPRSARRGTSCARARRRSSSGSRGWAPRCRCPRSSCCREKGLRGSYYGSAHPAAEIARLAGLVAEGVLPLADVVSHVTDLDGIEGGLERLRAGEGARTVAIMDAAAAGR